MLSHVHLPERRESIVASFTSLLRMAAWLPLLAGLLASSLNVAAQGSMSLQGQRAVVLGGGGATGRAWEIGLLKGLRDAGIDLTEADLIIGTSAGATLGAQLRVGQSLDALYDAMLAPLATGAAKENAPAFDVQYLQETSRM